MSPKGWVKKHFSFFGIKVYFDRIKSATKFLCAKKSSGSVVEGSISYEMNQKYSLGNAPFRLKFALKMTHPLKTAGNTFSHVNNWAFEFEIVSIEQLA